eukprot:1161086-Pelagomonas_calceolata.AAC.4
MDVLILEGDFSQASLCNVLGQMTISGLAPAPKGKLRVQPYTMCDHFKIHFPTRNALAPEINSSQTQFFLMLSALMTWALCSAQRDIQMLLPSAIDVICDPLRAALDCHLQTFGITMEHSLRSPCICGPLYAGTAKLEITMNVDANGVLNVTAHEQCNKRQEQCAASSRSSVAGKFQEQCCMQVSGAVLGVTAQEQCHKFQEQNCSNSATAKQISAAVPLVQFDALHERGALFLGCIRQSSSLWGDESWPQQRI